MYYFYERDAQLKQAFQDVIQTQILDTHSLKKGMREAITWIGKQIQ